VEESPQKLGSGCVMDDTISAVIQRGEATKGWSLGLLGGQTSEGE
jgi:hypothetical protein